MGGFFGISSRRDCLSDVFFGTDYHSHLGTRRGGLAVYDSELGLQREIHNISNSPFRTKFERVFEEMRGTSAIGAISDSDPQPLLIRSKLGTYAIATVGIINIQMPLGTITHHTSPTLETIILAPLAYMKFSNPLEEGVLIHFLNFKISQIRGFQKQGMLDIHMNIITVNGIGSRFKATEEPTNAELHFADKWYVGIKLFGF